MIEGRSIELEKTVLVGIINSNQNEEKSKEYLAELKFLTFTAGGEVIKSFTQKLDFPNPKTFIGSGKIIELLKFVKEKKISSVIFDDELTPTQQGNIEKLLKVKILDRTGLILIFLLKGPEPVMQEPKLSSHNINICFLGLRDFGRT